MYSSCLATVICCLVCNFGGRCAWARAIANFVLGSARLNVREVSAVVIENAPNELGWVIECACVRGNCYGNAIATASALAMGCVMALFVKSVKL